MNINIEDYISKDELKAIVIKEVKRYIRKYIINCNSIDNNKDNIKEAESEIDRMSEIIEYANEMRLALEQIANSPTPCNKKALESWHQTIREIASNALEGWEGDK